MPLAICQKNFDNNLPISDNKTVNLLVLVQASVAKITTDLPTTAHIFPEKKYN